MKTTWNKEPKIKLETNTSIRKLTLKADRIFSKYIRLRGADSNGMVKCFTCGKILYWMESDCGHFCKRQHKKTRYSEVNCQVQCKTCNWLMQGNDIEFYARLSKKYGQNVIDLLRSQKGGKITAFELNVIIDHYSKEVDNLLNK
jgi:hypothetical protein